MDAIIVRTRARTSTSTSPYSSSSLVQSLLLLLWHMRDARREPRGHHNTHGAAHCSSFGAAMVLELHRHVHLRLLRHSGSVTVPVAVSMALAGETRLGLPCRGR